MAISVGGGGNGNGRRRAYRPMAEINVTPFVDVMLVLLVIFMVTAPLLTVGVPVDLPKTQASALSRPDDPLVVSVTAKGELYIQESKVTDDELVEKLKLIAQQKEEQRIYVRCDKAVPHGRCAETLGAITAAGFSKIALIQEGAESPTGEPRRTPLTPPPAPGPRPR
jgi:biopolymer transport protein TolR